MDIEALPFVNWIFWAALTSGSLLVVGGTELLGGTTRGYRLFIAGLLAVCAAGLPLPELDLSPRTLPVQTARAPPAPEPAPDPGAAAPPRRVTAGEHRAPLHRPGPGDGGLDRGRQPRLPDRRPGLTRADMQVTVRCFATLRELAADRTTLTLPD